MPREQNAPPESPSQLPSEDAQLVRQLRQGDPEAGARFVREQYPPLYRYLLYLTNRPEVAEDLTQETFLQAWRALDTFDENAPLRPWLHRIAHREFLQALRQQQRRPAEQFTDSREELADLPAPGGHGWTDTIELHSLIGRLPVEERELVILHYLEGYEYREIARILGLPVGRVRHRLSEARCHLQRELGEGDLSYLNDPSAPMRSWAWLPLSEMCALEARLSIGEAWRRAQPQSKATTEETMERREFLRQAAAGAAGLMLPEPEKEIVDDRLTQKVTGAFKGTALSDLCEKLKSDTGVQVTAGPSVADEKVTLFCEKRPLREVMRQLSRPFGYTWLRSGTPGQYRYELVQDLRSQLLEEELRNRDRNAALLALDQEIEKYRPYLHLSPDEALERLKTAPPEEKKRLEEIANNPGVWGPLQIYFRLSPGDMAALRAGQRLFYREDPGPGERPLSPELRQGVFQTWRWVRLVKREDGFSATNENDPNGRPLSAIPEARACLSLEMKQGELGQINLNGASGYSTPLTPSMPRQSTSLDGRGPIAVGQNPVPLQPDNATVNARLAHDPSLQPVVTVKAAASGQWLVDSKAPDRPLSTDHQPLVTERKATSADVLEAVHQATGMPVIADFYTRLYPVETVSISKRSLFEALNQLGDTMRTRWKKGDSAESARPGAPRAWLQFRSITFYDDRRKEVPNRLLARWQNSRRQHGSLTLEDLIEIAQLPEEQLKSTDMAEGAKACWGLAEWEIMRNPVRHPYWRYLAEFTPAQRQKMTTAGGLPFTEMSLAQQQRFIAVGMEWDSEPLRSLDELAGAVLRVNYTVPGWFEWHSPGPDWLRWVVPVVPGREGRRVPRPLVVERTRDAALQTARRLFPTLREPLLQAIRRADPTFDEAQLEPGDAQIVPTKLLLEMVHVPGSSNKHQIHVVTSDWMGWHDTW